MGQTPNETEKSELEYTLKKNVQIKNIQITEVLHNLSRQYWWRYNDLTLQVLKKVIMVIYNNS